MGYSLVNHWDIIWDTMGHLYIYIYTVMVKKWLIVHGKWIMENLS